MSDKRLFLTFGLICCAGGAIFALGATLLDAPPLGVLASFLGGFMLTGDAALSGD